MISPEALWGAWALERFSVHVDGRPPIFPFGEGATGMLVYAPSGHMSAVLSRRERALLDVSRLETAGRAGAAERAGAFDSYLSYAGEWHIEGDEVVHRVTLALVPDAVGAENRRRAVLDGDQLLLSYEITPPSGNIRRYRLSWQRL